MSARTVADGPLLLTPAEAAEALRVDISELRTMRTTGSGPDFYDVGRGLIRYVRESVEVWATERNNERDRPSDRPPSLLKRSIGGASVRHLFDVHV